MNIITTEQMVCIKCDSVNEKILTVGKTYVVTTDKSIDTSIDIDITCKTFIGDDGNGYLLQYNDVDFITLADYRQRQLNKIL
jgi:hypothetical protein